MKAKFIGVSECIKGDAILGNDSTFIHNGDIIGDIVPYELAKKESSYSAKGSYLIKLSPEFNTGWSSWILDKLGNDQTYWWINKKSIEPINEKLMETE